MSARVRFGAFLAVGLAVAFALAFFVSPQASSKPDGLNKVAIDKGFDTGQRRHAMADLPTAGYAVRGVDNDRLSTGLAGVIGVSATFALAGGLLVVLRAIRSRQDASGATT